MISFKIISFSFRYAIKSIQRPFERVKSICERNIVVGNNFEANIPPIIAQ